MDHGSKVRVTTTSLLTYIIAKNVLLELQLFSRLMIHLSKDWLTMKSSAKVYILTAEPFGLAHLARLLIH